VSQTLPAWHATCNGKPRPRDANMTVAIPLVPGHETAAQSETSAEECALPELSPRGQPEDSLEDLIEMRYQQHLAQRALQELFEDGALQILES